MRNLYPGDIVRDDHTPCRLIIRETDQEHGRVKVQVGPDWTWVPVAGLIWEGDCLIRLPHTERGWRRIARRIGEVRPSEFSSLTDD